MSDQDQKQDVFIQPRFETARLTLDPPSSEDDIAMGAMFSDLPTMEHLRFNTKEAQGGWSSEDIIARRERQCKLIEERAGSTFYIHDKSTGELAGVCGANTINTKDRNAVVGIILWKKYWRGGYGTEALYEMMRGLFEDWNMHKVTRKEKEMRVLYMVFCVCILSHTWSMPSKFPVFLFTGDLSK